MLLREALEPQLDLGGPILKNAIVFMKRKGKRGDKKQDKFLYAIKTDLWEKFQWRGGSLIVQSSANNFLCSWKNLNKMFKAGYLTLDSQAYL